VTRLSNVVDLAGGNASKTQGNLLYNLATKLPLT
jgi:Glutaminyl-tRNA synthetase, non-specific RNA binding region part 1